MQRLSSLPLFPISLMGSWPRSEAVLDLFHKYRKGEATLAEFNAQVEKETIEFVKLQEKLGVDVITDGEFFRDNYSSFVADKVDGIKLMSVGQIAEIVGNKDSFAEALSSLDVPTEGIRNPICVGKLNCKDGLVADMCKLMRAHTDKPIKAAIPGPYLLTRSLWMPELSKEAYACKDKLAEDVVRILCEEVDRLAEIGVDVIQLDEPILSEVVYTATKEKTACEIKAEEEAKAAGKCCAKEGRSFMCGALAERKGPIEELEFASALVKQVVEYINAKNITSAVHMCRGNWSTNETTLLSGPYTPLLKTFETINARQLTLEFSTPRAGDLGALFASNKVRETTELGLGVVNPRTQEIESVDAVVARVEEAIQYIPKERIWLNPDCGFATFCDRPMNTADVAIKKIEVMAKAVEILRAKYK